ncbi:MAG TPA: SxtJ family membrane protein, partial [Candidatus Methylomirabilis sp.]|nr:SxtJ family membrane protein [Candidatus Methylomirabilis sp.]
GRVAVAIACAALALSIGLLGLIRPPAIRPIFVGWMMLVFPIGWVVSHVLLALVFYGLFTPVALVFRLVGRDALALGRRRTARSYWQARRQASDARQYFKQF